MLSKLCGNWYIISSAEEAIREAANCNEITDWVHSVVNGLNPSIKDYSKKQIDLALALILHEQVIRDAAYNDILIRFCRSLQKQKEVFSDVRAS